MLVGLCYPTFECINKQRIHFKWCKSFKEVCLRKVQHYLSSLKEEKPLQFLIPLTLLPKNHNLFCECKEGLKGGVALGHTGVFHKTSFDINYWHNLWLKALSDAFPFGIVLRTFMHHFFAKKCTLPLQNSILRIPFPVLFNCIFRLINLC